MSKSHSMIYLTKLKCNCKAVANLSDRISRSFYLHEEIGKSHASISLKTADNNVDNDTDFEKLWGYLPDIIDLSLFYGYYSY